MPAGDAGQGWPPEKHTALHAHLVGKHAAPAPQAALPEGAQLWEGAAGGGLTQQAAKTGNRHQPLPAGQPRKVVGQLYAAADGGS